MMLFSMDGEALSLSNRPIVMVGLMGADKTSIGCTACPLAGQGLTTTSTSGSLDITSCYIPAGTYSDEFGTFAYSENCHYAN